MDYIGVWRVHWAWSYEKEEKWLREMSNKGYELVSNSIIYYKFKKIEPKDVVYKIDYNLMIKDYNYEEFLLDCGWKKCCSCLGWEYYRCDADKCINQELYSDKEDSTKVINKIRRFMIALTLLEVFCIVFGFIIPIFSGEKLEWWAYLIYIFAVVEFSIINYKLYLAYKKRKR